MNPKAIDFLRKKKETVLKGRAFGTNPKELCAIERSEIARRKSSTVLTVVRK